jgi:PST family polysaccharide transporter
LSPTPPKQTKPGNPPPPDHFATDHLLDNLARLSVRGGIVTFFAHATKALLSLVGTYILAHQLTPNDFGLMGMVTAVTGFFLVFKDLGLTMATLQKNEINHQQISTLFWINTGAGFLMMALTIALAPLIAWFYQEYRLTAITLARATCYLFSGLAVQHQAILRRQMRFKALALIEIISRLAGILVAIVLAYRGLGYWALAFMLITFQAATTITSWLFCLWRPGRPVKSSGIRSMLAFGSNLTGFNIANYLFRNLDKIIIGRLAGSFSLGLYAKASELVINPIQGMVTPIATVAIPALSRLQQDPETFRRYYLRAVYMISLASMPMLLLMLFFSREIILLILGPQWSEAVPFFQIICLASIYQPIARTTSWLFISLGKTREMFRWRMYTIWLPITCFIVGVQLNGATGVAWGYAFSTLVLTIPTIWYAQKGTIIGTSRIFIATFRPLAAALLATGGARIIYQLADLNLIVCLGLAILSYPATTCLLAGSWSPIREILQPLYRHITS